QAHPPVSHPVVAGTPLPHPGPTTGAGARSLRIPQTRTVSDTGTQISDGASLGTRERVLRSPAPDPASLHANRLKAGPVARIANPLQSRPRPGARLLKHDLQLPCYPGLSSRPSPSPG